MSARSKAQRRAAVRRRRTLALVVLLAIAVTVVLVWRPWEPSAAADPERDPVVATSTPTPTPTPTATQQYTPVGGTPQGEGAGAACTAEQIAVTPRTDATTYAADQPVQMSFQIENTSEVVCTINVGTTTQQYEIRTGDDVVFRSTDCPIDQVDQIVELAPHTPQVTVPITWDRTRSSPETCASPRDPVVAGGASYHLNVTVSDFTSVETQQFILN